MGLLMLCVTTITSECTKMQGKISLMVTVASHITDHHFWLANIQDHCIIGLDILDKRLATVYVPRAMLYLGSEAVALHAAGEEGRRPISTLALLARRSAMLPPPAEDTPNRRQSEGPPHHPRQPEGPLHHRHMFISLVELVLFPFILYQNLMTN